jgi:hypothetical protein
MLKERNLKMLMMMWNRNKTATVVLSKIKEISLYWPTLDPVDPVSVKGWYNKHNHFDFGEFSTIDSARNFVAFEIMRKLRMAWNKDKTACVVLSKIKECRIHEIAENCWSVQGWFNQYNYFNFGSDFQSKEECQKFLNNINDRI